MVLDTTDLHRMWRRRLLDCPDVGVQGFIVMRCGYFTGDTTPPGCKKMIADYEQRIAELENQVELWKAHAEEERRRGMERAAEIKYITPALGNPAHGYTCGYVDGWCAYQQAIRAEIEK